MQKNLRILLKIRRLTVAELSRQSGVPAKTIYHWLTGQQPRKMDHLLRVCAVLETTVEELYGQPSSNRKRDIGDLQDEIHSGIYEVILRPVLKRSSSSGGS